MSSTGGRSRTSWQSCRAGTTRPVLRRSSFSMALSWRGFWIETCDPLQIVQQVQQRLVDDIGELGDERTHLAGLDRVCHGDRIRQQQPDEGAREYRGDDGHCGGKADAEARRAHEFTVWAIAEWVPLVLQPPTAVTQ